MGDDIASLILGHLRGMRHELQAFRTQPESDSRDVRARLTGLELGVASIKRELGQLFDDGARQEAGFDRLATA